MPSVRSSMIDSIDYDPDTRKMVVVFHNSDTYTYMDVPMSVYVDLMGAGSVGRAFHDTIKDVYEFVKG